MPAQNTDSILKLKGMYTLISRVGGQLVLISQFGKYMRARVEAIVSDPSDEANKAMIKDLLALKDFAERAVAEAFSASSTSPSISTGQNVRKEDENNDIVDDEKDKLDFSADFHYAIRAAFTAGFKAHRLPAPSSSPVTSPIKSPTSPISTRSSRSVVTRYRTGKPAELLAKYLDALLKTGQKGASHAEFMKNIYNALEMHRFSEDKDVFRTWYQKLLAKRLLMGKSASDDDERAVIQRLKDRKSYRHSAIRVRTLMMLGRVRSGIPVGRPYV
jgi:cullin-4